MVRAVKTARIFCEREIAPPLYDAKATECGIMTGFCASKIFEPVGPEKRSCAIDPHLRSDHVVAIHESPAPYGAKTYRVCCRGRCPHRPAPGRLRHGEWICAKPNPPHRWCGRRDGKPVPYDGKPTGYGIMTWFCVSKIFEPVGPEKRSYAIDPHLRSDQVGAAIGRPKNCGLQK